jgi:hypothetical protein
MTQFEAEADYNDRPARMRMRSRYERPRSNIIWTALLLGIILGMAAGLYYAWVVQPVAETDIAPWQLEDMDSAVTTGEEDENRLVDRDAYIIAVMMAYNYDGNLTQAVQRLVDLRLPDNDPIQYVADTACRLATSGYVDSNSRRNAVRSMMRFYQSQGKTGCADQMIMMDPGRSTPIPQVIVLPTPTLLPPATKTPPPLSTLFPTPTSSGFVPLPTSQQTLSFVVANVSPFCDAQSPGVIEVRVVERFSGAELPGYAVRVRGDDEESVFHTGLKPERGLGYADFDMMPGQSYIIEMPGLSDPYQNPLEASTCFDDVSGQQSVQSYRVTFSGG